MANRRSSKPALVTALAAFGVSGAAVAQDHVDMLFAPAIQDASVGEIIEIDMVAQSDGGSDVGFAAFTAALSWDPAELEFLGHDNSHSGYTWFVADFLNEPDGFNDDLTDGDAVFDALALIGQEALATPEGLIVTTLQFRVVGEGTSELHYMPTLGQFGESHVTALGGIPVTGVNDSVASVSTGGTPDTCSADLDGNGAVDTADMLALLGLWGTSPGGPPDLDGSGLVDTADFLELLGSWGPCP